MKAMGHASTFAVMRVSRIMPPLSASMPFVIADHYPTSGRIQVLRSDTAQYRFILTFRVSARKLVLPIPQCRISTQCQKLAPRKVTMSHNIVRELEIGDYKGQEFMAASMLQP